LHKRCQSSCPSTTATIGLVLRGLGACADDRLVAKAEVNLSLRLRPLVTHCGSGASVRGVLLHAVPAGRCWSSCLFP
jgi:hypothetical protein